MSTTGRTNEKGLDMRPPIETTEVVAPSDHDAIVASALRHFFGEAS